MSEFRTLLDARLLPECPEIEQWMLLNPLVFRSDYLKCEIVVPTGFVTDFLSFKELNFTAHRPTCVHDFLYSCSDVTQEQADNVLREMLESICCDTLLTEAIYKAVRLFGASHIKWGSLICKLSEHSNETYRG